jgi:hypothetical protein
MIKMISMMILIVHFVYRPIGDIDMELISYISLSGHLDDLMSTILHINPVYISRFVIGGSIGQVVVISGEDCNIRIRGRQQ